jgi:hypothetical protein
MRINVNHQRLTGEWCKHVRKDLKLFLNKRRRSFLKKLQKEEQKSNE